MLLLFTICGFAQTIQTIKLESGIYGTERELHIYLPRDYAENPQQKFETIYVFDSQNRQYFDQVHATLNFVNNWQFPMIVVGIVSVERNKEMLPKNNDAKTSEMYGGYLGEADKFLTFLEKEVIAYIDKNYRTLPTRIGIGHSNSATFLSYCFLEKPELFDAYIAASPNFDYDNQQFVQRFEMFDSSKITSAKFFYMCNADEKGGWITARNKIIPIFEGKKLGNVVFVNQDFSSTEDHNTVFPPAVFYGLKQYFNYQFFDVANLMAYYKKLDTDKIYSLNSDQANMLAYNFFWAGKTNDAITVMSWALERFPDDANLYDSMGELKESAGSKKEAADYYKQAMEVLAKNKKQFDSKTFEEKYGFYKKNYERVK